MEGQLCSSLRHAGTKYPSGHIQEERWRGRHLSSNVLNGVPGAVIPVAMMPVMAAVHVMPCEMLVSLVMIPPGIRMEGQPYTWEANSAIGVPAVAKAVAGHECGCAADRA